MQSIHHRKGENKMRYLEHRFYRKMIRYGSVVVYHDIAKSIDRPT